MHLSCRVCDFRYDMRAEDFLCPNCSAPTFSPVGHSFNWHGAPPELEKFAAEGSPRLESPRIAIEWCEELYKLEDERR